MGSAGDTSGSTGARERQCPRMGKPASGPLGGGGGGLVDVVCRVVVCTGGAVVDVVMIVVGGTVEGGCGATVCGTRVGSALCV